MARITTEDLPVERTLAGREADQVVGAGFGIHLGYSHGGVHWNGGGAHWGQPSWGGGYYGGYHVPYHYSGGGYWGGHYGGHYGYGHHGYGNH